MGRGFMLDVFVGLAALVLLPAGPLSAPAAEPPPVASATDLAPPAADSGFDLGLEALVFESPGQYHLFPETRLAEWEAPMARLQEQVLGAGFRGSPRLLVPGPMHAVTAASFDVGPDGRPQFKIFPHRSYAWEDLDTWEKIGLTMSYASTLAAIGYLVAEAVD